MSQNETYPPPQEFVAQANVQGMEGYRALYDAAKDENNYSMARFQGALKELRAAAP